MDKVLTVAFTLVLLVLAGACLIAQEWPDSYVHIIACDVGQGDGILITSGFWQALIDAGPDDKILECLDQQLPFWDKQIEVAVATHPDRDHIGGFAFVAERYVITQWWATNQFKSSDTFKHFLQLLDQARLEKVPIIQPQMGDHTKWAGDIDVLVWWPSAAMVQQWSNSSSAQFLTSAENILSASNQALESKNDQDTNDTNSGSITLFLQINQVSVVLTGDLGIPQEKILMTMGLPTKATVLKVGHHGSKTSSDASFINRLSPEVALIGVGKNNAYHHPNLDVLAKLHEVGAIIKRTDEMGRVEVVTDGEKYWLPM